MCSKYYSGILSTYQVEFWALGTLVPHKSDENDGMVEFELRGWDPGFAVRGERSRSILQDQLEPLRHGVPLWRRRPEWTKDATQVVRVPVVAHNY